MTRVKLRPNTSDQCSDLFRKSNPDIVADETDWQGAKMIFDRDTEIVTVLATWRDIESYKKMSGSTKYRNAMSEFSQFFASVPEISVNQVMIEMDA